MPHPNRRTWTLGTLDRETSYRLWFDSEAFRWEVVEAAPEGRPGAGDVGARAEDPRSVGPVLVGPPEGSESAGRRWFRRTA